MWWYFAWFCVSLYVCLVYPTSPLNSCPPSCLLLLEASISSLMGHSPLLLFSLLYIRHLYEWFLGFSPKVVKSWIV